MSAIVFASKAPRTGLTQHGVGFWRWLAILDLVLIVAWISITSVILVRGIVPVADLAGQTLMFLAMMCTLPTLVSQWKRARWSGNCEITLNDRCLFYACGATTFNWSWQDLSPLKIRPASRLSWYGFAHTRISLQNEGPIKRFLRSWREPTMIVDAYGTSLEDITTKLNEYREQALGNRVSGGRQSTPTGRDQP